VPPWKDYYRILQVEPEADQATLKKAYHKLAVIWHPDRNPDSTVAEERFKSIAEAYAVLSDPVKRHRYDQLGPDAFSSEYGTDDIFQGFDLNDLFREFGLPPLKETLFGILADDQVNKAASAPYQDFFAEFGQKPKRKKTIGKTPATGIVLAVSLKEAVFGAIKIAALNVGPEVLRVPVTVPKGTRGGQTITVPGKVPGTGRQPGDLMVTINITPDPNFKCLGQNIMTTLPLTRAELTTGCRSLVPTLEGSNLRLTVPPGTKSGSQLKAKGYGVPGSDGQRGDLIVTILAK
jgi:DnaJ-class molecular chaperone